MRRIENIRKPNRITAALESIFSRQRKSQRLESDAAPIRVSNGPISNGSAQPRCSRTQSATRNRRRQLRGFSDADGHVPSSNSSFTTLLCCSPGFVLIFDAFTLFDLLGDISKNHIPALMVLNYFRYLVPLMVYQLSPLASLVATLVTLAVLAKNNEVIAFKASGVSLYRIVLPLTLAGCIIAAGMFLLDDTFLPYANQRQDALRNRNQGTSGANVFSARAPVDLRGE